MRDGQTALWPQARAAAFNARRSRYYGQPVFCRHTTVGQAGKHYDAAVATGT